MTKQHSADGPVSWPAWLREVDLALPVAPQFLIVGNVWDTHFVAAGERGHRFAETSGLITDCLIADDYDLVYRYDPVDGIVLAHVRDGVVSDDLFPDAHLGRSTVATPGRLADLIKTIGAQDAVSVGVIIEHASRLWADEGSAGTELRSLLVASEKLAHSDPTRVLHPDRRAALHNSIFWISGQEQDAPPWLSRADTTRIISIPSPTLSVRARAARELIPALPGSEQLSPDVLEAAVEEMAEITQGMTIRSLQNVITLAIDRGIPAARIEEAVRSLRVGVLESPWQDPGLLERIAHAERIVENRVLGQSRPVRRSLDILLRSAMGLTGAQSAGRIGRPQGILFFAGPTGVGKTELAKALAEVLFGAEDAYTRFDMSEFSAEHSEARLIGAPPGYVGHDAGGQLTNAVRQKPFSVLLFDEIEKAHPRILDKFLQILEDGRLTDGSGTTVYFSEAVIIFTSNLGGGTTFAADPLDTAQPDQSAADDMESRVRRAIEHHFTVEIGRPELLNRLGDSIVVFNAISPAVAGRLVTKAVDAVTAAVLQRWGVELVIAPVVVEVLQRFALTRLSFGGRGVNGAVETALVNPLTRALFELRASDTTVLASHLSNDGGSWKLTLQRS